jgi:hypothetical protein
MVGKFDDSDELYDTEIERMEIFHDLYPKRCLNEAILAYREFCKINELRSSETSTIISLIPKKSSVHNQKTIIHEFLNYLLDLSAKAVVRKENAESGLSNAEN